MKHLLLTTIAAVLLVGCGESQQLAPAPESKPTEPVPEATQPNQSTDKTPDISIHDAAWNGNIEAVKQHIAAGTDLNAKDELVGRTPLHWAATNNVRREIVELLIANGADVNAMDSMAGMTPLHRATLDGYKEIAEEFIANGADVNAKDNNNETPPTHNNRNRGASGEGQVCRFTRGNAIALHLPVAVSKCRHPIPSA